MRAILFIIILYFFSSPMFAVSIAEMDSLCNCTENAKQQCQYIWGWGGARRNFDKIVKDVETTCSTVPRLETKLANLKATEIALENEISLLSSELSGMTAIQLRYNSLIVSMEQELSKTIELSDKIRTFSITVFDEIYFHIDKTDTELNGLIKNLESEKAGSPDSNRITQLDLEIEILNSLLFLRVDAASSNLSTKELVKEALSKNKYLDNISRHSLEILKMLYDGENNINDIFNGLQDVVELINRNIETFRATSVDIEKNIDGKIHGENGVEKKKETLKIASAAVADTEKEHAQYTMWCANGTALRRNEERRLTNIANNINDVACFIFRMTFCKQ